MDRHVKIYSKKGYIVAEISFYYEKANQVTYKITEYSMYESEDYETKETIYNTYVISGYRDDFARYVNFRQFKTMDEMIAHDRDFAKKELSYNRITNIDDYNLVYGPDNQQRRYFAGRQHRNEQLGVFDFTYNFDNNTKEMRFLSAKEFRLDHSITSDCLVTNMAMIAQLMYLGENWEEDWMRYYAGYDVTIMDTVY